MRTLVLISDSTGDLGERFVRALISQFPRDAFALKVYRFVQTERELDDVFKEIVPLVPILFHTTLSKELKAKIKKKSVANGMSSHDITGGGMSFLERISGMKSTENSYTLHEQNQEYDHRIAALNFTVEHDDSLGGETWEQADVILCGVSRTSKTPTSIYLANKGFRISNVPIVNGIPIPHRLYELPRLPLFGLEIDAGRLQEIRIRRALEEKIPASAYTDIEGIKEELLIAKKFFNEVGCPIVNVTHLAVEEIAAFVQKKMQLNPPINHAIIH